MSAKPITFISYAVQMVSIFITGIQMKWAVRRHSKYSDIVLHLTWNTLWYCHCHDILVQHTETFDIGAGGVGGESWPKPCPKGMRLDKARTAFSDDSVKIWALSNALGIFYKYFNLPTNNMHHLQFWVYFYQRHCVINRSRRVTGLVIMVI